MGELGRLFVALGALLLAVGLVLLFAPRLPLIGRLPGDFVFRGGNATVYIPLTTCLVVSLLLSGLFALFGKK